MKIILRGFRIHAIHHSWRLSRASLPACQSACQPASQPTLHLAMLSCFVSTDYPNGRTMSLLGCPVHLSVCQISSNVSACLSMGLWNGWKISFKFFFFFLDVSLSLSTSRLTFLSGIYLQLGRKKGEREGGWSETGGGNTRNCRLYELAEKRPPSQWSQVFFCSSNTFSNLSAKIAKTRRGVETKKKIEKGPT